MPRYRPPHCASAWHQQLCVCHHSRMNHRDESGVCNEYRCDCLKFELDPLYPPMEHETIR